MPMLQVTPTFEEFEALGKDEFETDNRYCSSLPMPNDIIIEE
jgi:hypothetical protein